MDTAAALIGLCTLAGPSGFEERVAKHVQKLLEPHMDETWIDMMGNVIGVRRCGKENAKKLLLDAHIDEIGFIITGVEEGFLRFSKLGGLDSRVLPSSCVTVLSDPPIFGVIGVLPPHVLKSEDKEKPINIEDSFIDIGVSQEDAVMAVPLGTAAVFAQRTRMLGNQYVSGKALDDRAGFISILNALEMLGQEKLDIDLYVMASVQEEVGVRGAAPGVFDIAPDWGIIVDVGHAKTPDSKPFEAPLTIGGGVSICRGPNMDKAFTEKVIQLAKERNIKHQIEVEPGGDSGTNARAIQVSCGGVATVLLSIPMKYMHTPCEMVSLEDINSTAQLIYETVLAIAD